MVIPRWPDSDSAPGRLRFGNAGQAGPALFFPPGRIKVNLR